MSKKKSPKKSKKATTPLAEPPHPAWDAGGEVARATLERFESSGYPPPLASEILTRVSRAVAEVIAQSGDDDPFATIFRLMSSTVKFAGGAVRALRDDRERRSLPVLTVACAEGCAYCCHLHASISVPEALILAEYLRDTLDDDDFATLRAHVESIAARVGSMTQGERLAAKIACPLLEPATKTCRAHAVRPLVCMGANSASIDACKNGFEQGWEEAELPFDPLQFGTARAVQAGLAVGIHARALDPRRYELASLLARVLTQPDPAARWLRGESFADAATPADATEDSIRDACDAFVQRDPHLARPLHRK